MIYGSVLRWKGAWTNQCGQDIQVEGRTAGTEGNEEAGFRLSQAQQTVLSSNHKGMWKTSQRFGIF
jgi:hypothetical protein